jgi:hypothetical protein
VSELSVLAHELHIRLDLSSAQLFIQDELELAGGAPCLQFTLSSRFLLESAELDGFEAEASCEQGPLLQRCELCVEREVLNVQPESLLRLRYRARLEDVSEAEQPVFQPFLLGPNDAWYARLGDGDGAARFSLELELPEGFDACAAGRRIVLESPGQRRVIRFEGVTPVPTMSLALGRWGSAELHDSGWTLRTLLIDEPPERHQALQAQAASILLRLSKSYGALPYPELSIVELPRVELSVSPGCVLVSSAWLQQAELDEAGLTHELLHFWFGLGVFPSHGGNWTEGLVTYLGEHEQAAQRSSEHARALRKRLLWEHQRYVQSRREHPLTLFKQGFDRASQSLGYARAAMVFHMLRRELGEGAFFDALRELVKAQLFRFTSWDELLLFFEEASGERLAKFSLQWWERSGAPSIRLGAVEALESSAPLQLQSLRFEVEQGDPSYRMLLPIRVLLPKSSEFNTTVLVPAQRRSEIVVDVPARAMALRLDPDYDVLRLLNDDEFECVLADAFLETAAQLALHPELSVAHLDEVELGVASALLPMAMSNSFEEALHGEHSVVFVLPSAQLELFTEMLRELPASPVLEAFQASAGGSLALALRRASGAPVVLLVVSPDARLYDLLLALAPQLYWSAVVFDAQLEVTQRLRWPSSAASLSWTAP